MAQITTALTNKADIDLSNVNSSGTSLASGWSMPSGTYDNLTLGTSGSTYTAPANGWFMLTMTANGSQSSVWLVTKEPNRDTLCSSQVLTISG